VAVRVRLRLRSRFGGGAETVALVNSGYEADSPQLLVPRPLAARLGIWPPPPEAELVEVGTAGGPVRNYLVRRALEVWLVAGDRTVGPVEADAMISSIEQEALISDQLGGALGIVILDLRGKWRLSDEDRVRHTEPPQYWY
jgi:hypothetical protein